MNVDSMTQCDSQELSKEIGQVMQESNERMRVDNLLNHESEMDSAEPVSERDLVAFITGSEEGLDNGGEGSDDEVVLPPRCEQLRILADAHVILSSVGSSAVALRGLKEAQRVLRLQMHESSHQTRISDFFDRAMIILPPLVINLCIRIQYCFP